VWRAYLLALLAGCGAAARPQPASGPAAAPASQPASGGDAADEQVRALVESWRKAYEARSLDALAILYQQTPELVVVIQGRILRGWDAFRPVAVEFLRNYAKIELRVSDVRVVPLAAGAAAFAVARLHRRYGDNVTTREDAGAITWILRRDRGDRSWLIVGEDYSMTPVQP
jgi:uncharacterized protein (TIGR02246 family)